MYSGLIHDGHPEWRWTLSKWMPSALTTYMDLRLNYIPLTTLCKGQTASWGPTLSAVRRRCCMPLTVNEVQNTYIYIYIYVLALDCMDPTYWTICALLGRSGAPLPVREMAGKASVFSVNFCLVSCNWAATLWNPSGLWCSSQVNPLRQISSIVVLRAHYQGAQWITISLFLSRTRDVLSSFYCTWMDGVARTSSTTQVYRLTRH